MIIVAFRIFTGNSRLGRSAQQVIAGTPPAHGYLQQQSRLTFIGTRLADPDIASTASLIQRMAKVLVDIRFQVSVLCKGALSVKRQQIKRLPQQVRAKAVTELLIGEVQSLVNVPVALRSLFISVHVSSFSLMAALCQFVGFQSKKFLETTLGEDFQ